MFKITKNGMLPTKGSKYAACVDLYSRKEIIIESGQTVLVPLGVSIDEDFLLSIEKKYHINHKNSFIESHYLQLMLRSSLSKNLIIANGVGIIDLDYRDEIMIRVHNPMQNFIINKGDRVAQITLLEHKISLFNIFTNNQRDGGFGSTGTN